MLSHARFAAFLALLCSFTSARGQPCDPQWVTADGVPGTNGIVLAASLWDPDGGGPLAPKIVIGGNFTSVEGVVASNIAMRDTVTGQWSPVGTGTNSTVHALAVLSTGELAVGGAFTTAGGVSTPKIARWNGSVWSGFGTGMSHSVRALMVAPSGQLIAGGDFITAGGTSAQHVARWNGSGWLPMGLGFNGMVQCFTTMHNGDIIAGGAFSFSGGTRVSSVARWNGSSWLLMGVGLGGILYDLEVLPDGTLIAGGDFARLGPPMLLFIAQWNGTAWSGIGSGMDSIVFSMAQTSSGELIAGGGFTIADGTSVSHIARRSNGAWIPLGSGVNHNVNAIVPLPGGDLFVGGQFHVAGGMTANTLATYSFGTPPPVITQNPTPASACADGDAPFSVNATGVGPLTYQWQLQTAPDTWVTLGTDPAPIACSGNGVAFATPFNSPIVNIGVHGCLGVQHWSVHCVVANPCGSVTSDVAILTICPVDFNCDGAVNSADFFDFITAFFGDTPASDFNRDTVVDSQDFFDFLAAFFAEC